MQEKSVCCRALPCLAPDLTPSTQGTYPPPPYFPGHWELSLLAALNKDGSGQRSGQPRTAQSGSAATRQCMNILFFISH
jgi:hypothetical protein